MYLLYSQGIRKNFGAISKEAKETIEKAVNGNYELADGNTTKDFIRDNLVRNDLSRLAKYYNTNLNINFRTFNKKHFCLFSVAADIFW